MQNFPEQLTAARKAQGMTQEKLAEIMNVSRPMVSHWETGRTQPDLESVRRLSKVLQYDFLHDEMSPNENMQVSHGILESDMKPTTAHEGKESRKRRIWRYLCVFLGGTILTAALGLIIFFPKLPQATGMTGEEPPIEPELFIEDQFAVEAGLLEWYKQPNERVKGRAYVAIASNENPVKAIRTNRFDIGVGWFYTLYLKEENGIDFRVEECTLALFFTETRADIKKSSAIEVKAWWGKNVIPGSGQQIITGGFPRADMLGIGVKITGVDAKGRQLEFHYFLELSQEIAEDATGEDTANLSNNNDPFAIDADLLAWHKQPNERVKGQAYVNISTDENPLKAMQSRRFGSGVGWFVTFFMEEENGIGFLVDEFRLSMFYTDTRAYVERHGAGELKIWWGNNAIPGWGQRAHSISMPRKDMLGIGIMVMGVDANGNELEFHYFLELSQEIAE